MLGAVRLGAGSLHLQPHRSGAPPSAPPTWDGTEVLHAAFFPNHASGEEPTILRFVTFPHSSDLGRALAWISWIPSPPAGRVSVCSSSPSAYLSCLTTRHGVGCRQAPKPQLVISVFTCDDGCIYGCTTPFSFIHGRRCSTGRSLCLVVLEMPEHREEASLRSPRAQGGCFASLVEKAFLLFVTPILIFRMPLTGLARASNPGSGHLTRIPNLHLAARKQPTKHCFSVISALFT